MTFFNRLVCYQINSSLVDVLYCGKHSEQYLIELPDSITKKLKKKMPLELKLDMIKAYEEGIKLANFYSGKKILYFYINFYIELTKECYLINNSNIKNNNIIYQNIYTKINKYKSISKQNISDAFKRIRNKSRKGLGDYEAFIKIIEQKKIETEKYYIWYQLNNELENKDFICVFGNIESIKRTLTFGNQIIGYDATYNVNMYGYPLWLFTGRDQLERGFPLIFAISKKKDIVNQVVILRQFKVAITSILIKYCNLDYNSCWNPNSIVIDKDIASLKVK